MAAKTSSNSGESKYEHLIDSDERDLPETCRMYDEFPAGPECQLAVTDIPDDENEYGWTDHYENESRERSNPPVTDAVVTEILTEGVVREAPGENWDNRYLVQREIDGKEWTIVVADDYQHDEDYYPEDRWVLITVFSNYHGTYGTTNRYFDRLQERRRSNEEDGS